MTGLVLRVALLLFILLPAAAGMVQLVAISNAGYACLVVPVGPDMPEWTLDVRSGRAVWDGRHLGAPIQSSTVSYSPDGRYGLGASERREDERWTPFGWYLEDTHTGTRTPLPHSFGYTIWSDDSSTVAYITEANEIPRQLTIVNATSGIKRTQPITQDDDLASMSPNGRYLLLRNTATFERRVLQTSDMQEVVRATPRASLSGTPWSPQSNRMVMFSDERVILYDLDRAAGISLGGLPASLDRMMGYDVHWSPDGERFALLTRYGDLRKAVHLFDADGEPLLPPLDMPSPSQHITTLQGLAESSDRPPWSAWSADGTRFAALGGEALNIVDLTTGQPETVIAGIEWIGLQWENRPPGADKYLPFVHSIENGMALTILDLDTLTIASQLIDGATRIAPPIWTADFSRVAVRWDDDHGRTRLTWASSSDFTGHLLDEPGQLYGETAWNPSIFWLGSNPILLYAAGRDGSRSIYIAHVETGETHAIAIGLTGNYPHISLGASPHGDRFVVRYLPQATSAGAVLNEVEQFILVSGDGRYIRDLPPAVDQRSIQGQPLPWWYNLYGASWSPDGKWFAQRNRAGLTRIFDADGNLTLEAAGPSESAAEEWTRCAPLPGGFPRGSGPGL